MKPNRLIIFLLLLFTTGCGIQVQEGSGGTSTPFVITQTLPPPFTLAPTYTLLPPPPTPTPAPVDGTATTQINVRSQPSTSGEVLGIVAANARVQIIGKDPGGSWWQILYPAGIEGKGWVTAQYVTTAGTPNVPVIGGGGTGQTNGNVAIIQQKINVRSGPGTDFNSLGTLNPQDVVNLTGKDASGAWLQIEFMAGPDGRGWINAAFAQAKGVENLPIITEAGLVVGTGTPTRIPPSPTSTIIPAPNDNDSQSSPAVNVDLDAETKTLIYRSDVSTPEGDTEDWISFTSSSPTLLVTLECSEAGSVKAELFGGSGNTFPQFVCGEPTRRVEINTGVSYSVHLWAEPSLSGVRYSTYTITIEVIP